MLVNYSSSSSSNSDSEDEKRHVKKPKSSGPKPDEPTNPTSKGLTAPPPLPAGFHDIYTGGPRTVLNHALHSGRARAVAHVEGSWPAHVSLEWFPNAAQAAALGALVEHVRVGCALGVLDWNSAGKPNADSNKPTLNKRKRTKSALPGNEVVLESLVQSDVGARLPLHVSLSDTMMVPGAEREAYRAELRAAVQSVFHNKHNSRSVNTSSSSSDKSNKDIITIELDTTKAKIFTNEACTRGFVALAVVNPEGQLQVRRLIELINTMNGRFGQPELGDVHAPHVSIAAFNISTPVAAATTEAPRLPLEFYFPQTGLKGVGSRNNLKELLTVDFTCVKLKMGKTAENIK